MMTPSILWQYTIHYGNETTFPSPQGIVFCQKIVIFHILSWFSSPCRLKFIMSTWSSQKSMWVCSLSCLKNIISSKKNQQFWCCYSGFHKTFDRQFVKCDSNLGISLRNCQSNGKLWNKLGNFAPILFAEGILKTTKEEIALGQTARAEWREHLYGVL